LKEGEKMTVGENIKRIRKEKGLTQKKLGELCGMNEVQIRRYEIGKANPKIKTIERIASALEVTPFDIMGLEYFDTITDLDSLRDEISKADQFKELFTSMYGDEEYMFFMQYCSLTEEGANKVKAYIKDLYVNPKNRADLP
jgi:transcriptional regulator with XRE-family HTH domain